MRINSTNSINFGYNKKLNQKLIERLQQGHKTPVKDTLLAINTSCNTAEDAIRKLEKGGANCIDRNEGQINVLLDYLMDAKSTLCHLVERLYPDLNYMKTECDTYDRESQRHEIPIQAEAQRGVKRAFLWRDMMVDELSSDIEELTSLVDDGDDDLSDTLSSLDTDYMDDDEYEAYTREEAMIARGEKPKESNLIYKYTPSKDSPKSLDDVVGLKGIREDIEDLILYPITNPKEAIQREEDYGIEIPHFIVFHGPPGCGKTMLAQAIAEQSGCDMYVLDMSKVGSYFVNQTSNQIAKAWDFVKEQAKGKDQPVIIFIDEMDSMLARRINDDSGGSREDNKATNTILTRITSAPDDNIMVIGATNMYDMIDPAVKRRVNLNAYVGLPNNEEISKLLSIRLSKFKKGLNLASDKEALDELSKELLGYSPSNIVNIVKTASKIAYKANREVIKEDITEALKQGSWEKIKEKDYIPENKKANKAKLGFSN